MSRIYLVTKLVSPMDAMFLYGETRQTKSELDGTCPPQLDWTCSTHNLDTWHTKKFDLLFAVDKSNEAGALSETLNATEKYGFGCDENGVIRTFTEHGGYQYELGLNDELKAW